VNKKFEMMKHSPRVKLGKLYIKKCKLCNVLIDINKQIKEAEKASKLWEKSLDETSAAIKKIQKKRVRK